MNYVSQLYLIRNDIHREIVQESTVRNSVNGNESDGVLRLTNPLYGVHHVCCENGYLLSYDADNIIRYQDLSVEQLSEIHHQVVNLKQYTFTLNSTLYVTH